MSATDGPLPPHAFEAVMRALPDPVVVLDAARRVVMENERARALLSAEPEDDDAVRRTVEVNHLLFSSFLARGLPPEGAELSLVDPRSGEDLRFEVGSTALEGAGAESVVFVLRDVSALRRALTELEHQFRRVRREETRTRRERDHLNLVLENAGDPIVVTDDQAGIVLLNRAAERIFPANGTHEADAVPAENARRLRQAVADLLASDDDARTVALELRAPASGVPLPTELVAGKIRDPEGATTVVCVVHDLTQAMENARLAAELTQLNAGLENRVRDATGELAERNRQLEWQSEELERAYRLKSDFLASMSHELRTPINALLGYTTLMQDQIYGDLTPRQVDALQRMRAASEHLLELINDILDLAKIETGKMPIHLAATDLAEVIEELSETVEPMVRARGLEYEVAFPPDLPPVRTDRKRIEQVLFNLLSNAVKFTPTGAIRVEARVVDEGAAVEVAVIDTGIGIAEDEIAAIWEDFRQVDQSSTREHGGTGLGLSITRKLLLLLGGSVRVESTPGAGSVFTVWLPLG